MARMKHEVADFSFPDSFGFSGSKGMAKGGKVKCYADGGIVDKQRSLTSAKKKSPVLSTQPERRMDIQDEYIDKGKIAPYIAERVKRMGPAAGTSKAAQATREARAPKGYAKGGPVKGDMPPVNASNPSPSMANGKTQTSAGGWSHRIGFKKGGKVPKYAAGGSVASNAQNLIAIGDQVRSAFSPRSIVNPTPPSQPQQPFRPQDPPGQNQMMKHTGALGAVGRMFGIPSGFLENAYKNRPQQDHAPATMKKGGRVAKGRGQSSPKPRAGKPTPMPGENHGGGVPMAFAKGGRVATSKAGRKMRRAHLPSKVRRPKAANVEAPMPSPAPAAAPIMPETRMASSPTRRRAADTGVTQLKSGGKVCK